MAINENNALKATHICYLAGTGGGKTTAVKLMGLVGKCVAIFDLYGDYKYDGRKAGPFNGLGGRPVYHYSNRNSFAQAFISAWSSGLAFAVAYRPEFPKNISAEKLKRAKQAELHWFASLVWEASDGNRQLDVIIEELAKLSDTIGKDDSIVGELATGGRKYGIALHTIFQRSQEVPKTIWSNSPRKVLGSQESQADAKRISIELDAELSDVYQLSKMNSKYEDERLHYIVKSKGGIGNIEPVVIHLKSGKSEKLTFEDLRAT
ncbi:hypothetical protein [Pseudoalteromonas luteoviolacea]|uniref:Helicase HerA central domain-containing protein n=1 Tax=Pseudoalteromonas luteoviolacea NCIMB 1942 TaxID=1365253 RepID=A0A167B049_9GAMM|nr:hypothetical protein [Pseudoalteromonas luteoviolacea]KZN46006.1 hypothetical protein N482_13100 [Pseudoalteromonas luteoviolacea NCIMB 1942]